MLRDQYGADGQKEQRRRSLQSSGLSVSRGRSNFLTLLVYAARGQLGGCGQE